MNVGACRDRISAALGAARFERFFAREDLPGGDQHLAGDRALGGVRLASALLDVQVQPVARVRRPPGALRGLRSPPTTGRFGPARGLSSFDPSDGLGKASSVIQASALIRSR